MELLCCESVEGFVLLGDDMVSMSEDDRSRNVEGRAARKVELVLKCPGTLES